MNRRRRESLREAASLITRAGTIVESVCDAEQDSLDNYPENLQGTERFEQMESAVDSLNDAMDKIDEVKSHIESAIG